MEKFLLVLLLMTAPAQAADIYYGNSNIDTRAGQRFVCSNSLPCGIITDQDGTREYPGSGETAYLDINSYGVTVGYLVSGRMLATRNGAVIGSTSVSWSRAWRINDAGQILYSAYAYSFASRKYVYSECIMTGASCLPLPKESTGGYSATYSYALNNLGHTGGVYYLADQAKGYGFIRANGATTTLEYPGAIITTVTGLNDIGDASGSACLATSRDYWVAGASCIESVGFKWKSGVFETFPVAQQDLNNNDLTAN